VTAAWEGVFLSGGIVIARQGKRALFVLAKQSLRLFKMPERLLPAEYDWMLRDRAKTALAMTIDEKVAPKLK